MSQPEMLLDELRHGSQEAFEIIFRTYYGRVFALAYRLLGSATEADDVAQEAFLRLYLRPLPPGREHNLGGWLMRVATNLGYNALRSRRRRQAHENQAAADLVNDRAHRIGPAGPTDTAGDTDHINDDLGSENVTHIEADTGAAEGVREVLAQLPERQAQLLLLRHAGLSYNEIATALGVAPGSIGTLLARAEQAFRERYMKLEGRGQDA